MGRLSLKNRSKGSGNAKLSKKINISLPLYAIIHTFAAVFYTNHHSMKCKIIIIATAAALMTSCAAEFNQAYKSQDYTYKYEFAKAAYAEGRYSQAIAMLDDVVAMMKGTDNAEECLYMLAMAQYHYKDYETAAQYFRKYYKTYPKGQYAEQASFNIGESLYMSAPEPRLDQTETINAMNAFQEYLDIYVDAKYKATSEQRLVELEEKLIKKELHSAQLYYNLGSYFGNCTSGGSNYEACIVTSQNAIKNYPYSALREDFAFLIVKSKYQLAEQSVEEKKPERYRDAEDECYGFINEYPESAHKDVAEKYIAVCKKMTKGLPD